MNGAPELRASDADRDATVAQLREHAAAGRLTLEEFTERMSAAYEAQTTGELAALARDLPPVPAAPERRPSTLALAIFGDTELSGRIRLAGRLVALKLFGDVALDLRHATVEGDAKIVSISIFGDIDLYLPEGVDVDVRSVSIFGDRTTRGSAAPPLPGAPLVRVLWITLFGDLQIWRVPSGWGRKTLREIRRGLRS